MAESPILVHIGYHKTGSSWIEHRIFGNPSTGYRALDKSQRDAPVHRLIRDRPLDFDAASIRAEFDPLFADAKAAGLRPVVCFARLSGHAYSGGYDSKLIADRLKEVIPEARILIVIREQRSMAVSTYKQYVRAGGVAKVEHFLEPPKAEARVPGFDYRHFEYDRLIAHYHSLYGNEAVLVLPYERLVADARGFIATIAEFAGQPIPDDVLDRLPYTKRATAAKTALWTAAIRPLNRFGDRSDLNPEPLLGAIPVNSLRRRLGLLNSPRLSALQARREQRLRADVKRLVGSRYIESNRRTAGLTGIDLAALGWML